MSSLPPGWCTIYLDICNIGLSRYTVGYSLYWPIMGHMFTPNPRVNRYLSTEVFAQIHIRTYCNSLVLYRTNV